MFSSTSQSAASKPAFQVDCVGSAKTHDFFRRRKYLIPALHGRVGVHVDDVAQLRGLLHRGGAVCQQVYVPEVLPAEKRQRKREFRIRRDVVSVALAFPNQKITRVIARTSKNFEERSANNASPFSGGEEIYALVVFAVETFKTRRTATRDPRGPRRLEFLHSQGQTDTRQKE